MFPALLAVAALSIGAYASLYLAPETATQIALSAERRMGGLERKEITLPDGLRYVYLEGGRGEPLLLLHGFGANKDNYVRVARQLTEHYRVIAPDHIGFGESTHPADADYRPLAQVERLRQLVAALGLKRVHLGGSSMGGQIALIYAARYPDEVASLWLLDPAGIWSAPRSEMHQIIAGGGRNPLMAQSADEFAAIYAFVMSDPPFIPRPLLDVMARERIANHALEERIFREITSDSVEARVAGLKTPSLIVFGARDRVIHPGSAEILHKLLPNSRVVILPNTGHLPMLEKPRRSAEDYLKFRAALAAKK